MVFSIPPHALSSVYPKFNFRKINVIIPVINAIFSHPELRE